MEITEMRPVQQYLSPVSPCRASNGKTEWQFIQIGVEDFKVHKDEQAKTTKVTLRVQEKGANIQVSYGVMSSASLQPIPFGTASVNLTDVIRWRW